MKHKAVYQYSTLLGLLATEAWFLWNPGGWKFQWEPVVVFIGLLGTYVTIDIRSREKQRKHSTDVHPNDISLFKKLQEILPSDGPIQFIRKHDFGGAFNPDKIKPFHVFESQWDNAAHEFIDKDLEKIRKDLLKNCRAFLSTIGEYTFSIDHGLQKVGPVETTPKSDFSRKRNEAVKAIHSAVDSLVESHERLVRLARKLLRPN